jgi:UDP-galactopyranose mutase
MFGAVFAQQMVEKGKTVLVVEKRGHIGGNCYTEELENIHVHKYGPHIFHTSDEKVWEYVNRFAEFNHFVNRPKVIYKGKLYSFPVNLMTLYQLWDVTTPAEAKRKLEKVAIRTSKPQNLEEWVLAQVGEEIYEIFIKGYTKKQWQKDPKELPASIIKRVPIRLTFEDNYYNDRYQGIPIGGYTNVFERMLNGIEVKLNTDYFADRDYWDSVGSKVVYTGKIDEYFGYKFGQLDYRSLRFETKVLDGDYQGNAVVNYTEAEVPYTRVIEHKHFEFNNQAKTAVTWEYPDRYEEGKIPYYPIHDARNSELYNSYKQEAEQKKGLLPGGRLATYTYLDMDEAVAAALSAAEKQDA